ncbi:hypothetical protein Gpo141_00014949, partial [Globisporangium polare]
AFHSDWLSYGTSGKDPSKLVFWRYKVAGESRWRLLSDNADHVFTQSETLVTLEAWSQCGLVAAFPFTVNLHVHSRAQVCEIFGSMWFQTSTAPSLADPGALCNVPKSDFVELTFNFQPSLGFQSSAAVADVSALSMAVSRVVCSASIGGRPGAEILRVEGKNSSFEIARQFAVQLQQTPTTTATTSLRVDCSFTYTKYDLATTVLPCSKSFTLTDCDEPCIGETQSDTCDLNSCTTNKDLPVLYEACSTSVVTATAAQTLLKPRASTCCQACSV